MNRLARNALYAVILGIVYTGSLVAFGTVLGSDDPWRVSAYIAGLTYALGWFFGRTTR